jgi:hypothetical protein
MDTSPVVSMDALWPGLAEQRRPFEVVVTVAHEDGGEPLVPRALPPEMLGCWSSTQATASVTVLATQLSRAAATASPWTGSPPSRSPQCAASPWSPMTAADVTVEGPPR